jgi:hypothetical protein
MKITCKTIEEELTIKFNSLDDTRLAEIFKVILAWHGNSQADIDEMVTVPKLPEENYES